MAINVKDPQFGAAGDGSRDDAPAIQAAINYAKSLQANPFAQYKATVYFPAGYYLINSSINLTGAGGIWLVGDGGPYLNTIILGNTGNRPMFDFTGSSQSGCENFTFLPSSASAPSTLGVQFALSSTGGLNCGIKRCYFQMTDVPTANGGFGSIGLLNVRSEEFYIHECLIRANVPLVMSYAANITYTGVNYTATSNFQTVTAGSGSMGVTSINGTSLQTLEKRQPAVVLNGTNSFNFQGYMSRLSTANGTNETAILCLNSTINLKIHATIESFSRLLQVRDTGFAYNQLDIISANSTAPTTELIDVTNCIVTSLRARIGLPNASERANRTVLYHAPASNGTQQVAGIVQNSEIDCYDITNNNQIITQALLKKSANMVFNTGRPFEKKGGKIRQLTNNRVSAGTLGALTTATIFQFQEARLTSTTANNSGYYRINIDGVLKAGGYGSGAAATLCFEAQIVVNQKFDGTLDPISITTVILDQSVTNPSYLNVNGMVLDLTFSGGIGRVTLVPRVSGSGTGEAVYYEGSAEIQSDFFVNDPVPL
ncbi:glycosyl hydrolase family 28-related protein [Fibrella sp. WM1]|uniref:glycosyl hydrolase family 28-related protein n=1 Tax=Fibrella musci TaxID=3242485 RepID=UPI0035208BA4